jgi:hypothetical protein
MLAAVAAGLVDGHEPLVGEHGLDHLAGARAARHHQLVLLGFDQQAQRVEVGHHLLARHEAVQPAVGGRGVVVDLGVQVQHADHGQAVALAHGIVVGVVRRRDLDHAGAELAVDVGIGDHRDQCGRTAAAAPACPPGGVALVVGVHHHRGVAEHRLGARGGHHQAAAAVFQRVADVPQQAVFLFAFDLQVGHRALSAGSQLTRRLPR